MEVPRISEAAERVSRLSCIETMSGIGLVFKWFSLSRPRNSSRTSEIPK